MGIQVETVVEDGIAIIRVEADVIAAEQGGALMRLLRRALKESPMAVIDLSGVFEMGSVVAYALARMLSEGSKGYNPRFAIAAAPAAMKRLFNLLDLHALVPLHDYTDSALLALQTASLCAVPDLSVDSASARAGRTSVPVMPATTVGADVSAPGLPHQTGSLWR